MGCLWMLMLLPSSVTDAHHTLIGYYLFLILSSFLVCVVAFLAWSSKSRTSNFPPGPLALPVLGHLHLLGELPHQSLHKLSKIHGPLMGLRLGSVPVIVASTPDMAAQILQTHDLVFASRPLTAAAIYNMLDRSDIALSPYGPHWRLMRQICVTRLFSTRMLNSFMPIRDEEVALLMRSVFEDSKTGREVTVRSKLVSVASNVISRMTIGKRLTELGTSQDMSKSILDLISEMHYLDGVFNIGDYIPYLQWMDLQGYVRRMKLAGKNVGAIFQQIVDARRELRREELTAPKDLDLLDVLLSVSMESQRDVQLTDDKIKAVLLDMFTGGTETTAFTTEWALAELLINPEIMKKAQEELDFVVGNERFVQESDIAQLPYLQAVVKETMRLHPVGPLLIPHESTQPCKIAGTYDIPAKTTALVNVWAIGRDETVWERPEEFLPERFLESSVDVRGQHFQLLPFGSGRRMCPALTMGLLNVQMMLSSLVHGFELWLPSLSDGSKTLEGLVVAKAKPLVSMAAPRLPHHLYYCNS